MEAKTMKIEQFTEGQIDLLKALVQGCNIALYRTGQIRLRDKEHNPLRNLRNDMFESVKQYLVRKDGLFYINPDIKDLLPRAITG